MDFTKEGLVKLITDGIEEHSQLEYKAAGAVSRAHRHDISKDISAFANAAGGTLIYGISEDRTNPHLPGPFDPINCQQFSKEWLDQIIGLIRPRIEGLRIIPVHVGPGDNDYCYVVEVPEGATAHQALDLKYYRRRNFENSPMEDYEIREVMNRKKHPLLEAQFRVTLDFPLGLKAGASFLSVRLHNTSKVLARHWAVMVQTPLRLSKENPLVSGTILFPEDAELSTVETGHACWLFTFTNSAGSPLFPDAKIVLRRKLRPLSSVKPDAGVGIEYVVLTLYADGMERVVVTKDWKLSAEDWV